MVGKSRLWNFLDWRIMESKQLPLFPVDGVMGKLEEAFWIFHQENPRVYEMLVKFAREWRRRRGPDAKLGIKELFERVRWEVSLVTSDESFKLNNNHTAFYARLIMRENEDLKDIFRLRQQRIQSTIGPDDKNLPSGVHDA
jgi:hypothetical protein